MDAPLGIDWQKEQHVDVKTHPLGGLGVPDNFASAHLLFEKITHVSKCLIAIGGCGIIKAIMLDGVWQHTHSGVCIVRQHVEVDRLARLGILIVLGDLTG